MFEKASRKKYRYNYRGSISTEDLWDLSPAALDSIYKFLQKSLHKDDEVSLLDCLTAEQKEQQDMLETQMEIVKHIFTVKKNEAAARKEAADEAVAKNQKKAAIMEIINQKENDDLKNKSKEELIAMLQNL